MEWCLEWWAASFCENLYVADIHRKCPDVFSENPQVGNKTAFHSWASTYVHIVCLRLQVRLVPRKKPLVEVSPLTLAQFTTLAFNRRRAFLGASLMRLGAPEGLLADLYLRFGDSVNLRYCLLYTSPSPRD